MSDLKTQIRAYVEEIDPLFDPRDLMRRARLSTHEPPAYGWKPAPLVAFAAAFILILGAGAVLLLFGSPETRQIADHHPIDAVSAEELSSWRWTQIAAGQPWSTSVVDIEPMGPDGFVAIVDDGGTVYWSPNGKEWLDGDPKGSVVRQSDRGSGRVDQQLVVTVGDQAFIHGGTDLRPGVWVGRPDHGSWRFLPLDIEGLLGDVQTLSVAANESQVLIVGVEVGDEVPAREDEDTPVGLRMTSQYLVWVLDAESGTMQRASLPDGLGKWRSNPAVVAAWYQSEWIVGLVGDEWLGEGEGWKSGIPLLTSSDGVDWRELTTPETLKDSITSLTAGRSALIATRCDFGGDTFLVSTDGEDWNETTSAFLGHRSTYSDTLGFLVVHGDEFTSDVVHSPDGTTWSVVGNGGPSGGSLAAGGNALLVADETGLWSFSAP